MTTLPSSLHSGKKRSNRKRKSRSHTTVEDDSLQVDSSPNAFWQNYQKAFQWGNNQEVAYWRSRAVALELENKMLRQQIMRLTLNDKDSDQIEIMRPPEAFNNSFTSDHNISKESNLKKLKRNRRSKKRIPTDEPEDDVIDSQFEFEVTEEMKDFFELHMLHKIEQEKKHLEAKKKSEEDVFAAGEENAKLISHPMNFSARADELKLLYGDSSPKIHGMETAVQLTFRRYCEKNGARLWPNIPLRC